MENVWLTSALWIGLALLASLISIRIAVSVALVEIEECGSEQIRVEVFARRE